VHGNHHISCTVDALVVKLLTREVEVTKVERIHGLHEILFNTSTCGNINIDHLVLAEIADVFAHTTRRHV
jgi:hypothetical protein